MKLIVVAALAVLALGAPGSASAADSDVVAAWQSQSAAMNSASKSLVSALRRGERTRFRRAAPVVKAIERLRVLTDRTRDLVAQETASTPSGAAARGEVLRSLDGFVRSLRDMRLAVQAASRRRLSQAHKLLKRSKRRADAAKADSDQAVALFDKAGREAAPPPPPSPPPPPPPPPCDDKDPNTAGCQTEPPPPPPCDDKDPNQDGCQTEPPCQDQNPILPGCQPDAPPAECTDQNPYVSGCQETKSCRDAPEQSGCPPICAVTPEADDCADSPSLVRVATRRRLSPESGTSPLATAAARSVGGRSG